MTSPLRNRQQANAGRKPLRPMAQQNPKPTLQQTPLLKALTDAGVGSRRGLADAIRQGRVEVNDTVVDDFRYPLNLERDRVSLDKRQVDLRPLSPVYILLHKPEGVLSTTSDSRGRTTVIDILPDRYRRLSLHLVGRLDKDSTGLLLLTSLVEETKREEQVNLKEADDVQRFLSGIKK